MTVRMVNAIATAFLHPTIALVGTSWVKRMTPTREAAMTAFAKSWRRN